MSSYLERIEESNRNLTELNDRILKQNEELIHQNRQLVGRFESLSKANTYKESVITQLEDKCKSLQEENEKLLDALRPFAALADTAENIEKVTTEHGVANCYLMASADGKVIVADDFRRARTVVDGR